MFHDVFLASKTLKTTGFAVTLTGTGFSPLSQPLLSHLSRPHGTQLCGRAESPPRAGLGHGSVPPVPRGNSGTGLQRVRVLPLLWG